jgi:segregation and condensation protein B
VVAQIVEAPLFVGGEPISSENFGERFPEIGADAFEACVALLRRRYRSENRPYGIRRIGGGYRLKLKHRFAEQLAARIRPERSATLARPVVEVLSVIAYRQPISRVEIERIVGIDVRGILGQLKRRELIGVTTSEEDADLKLFVTTARFLDVFALDDLADLPASEDLQSM